MGEKLLDEDEVADIIGISPHTLRSWRVHGRQRGPRFLKVSARCVRYRVEAVEAAR
jgi:predicted site-specific integrase-resolvase